jgi:hypothetical protein
VLVVDVHLLRAGPRSAVGRPENPDSKER